MMAKQQTKSFLTRLAVAIFLLRGANAGVTTTKPNTTPTTLLPLSACPAQSVTSTVTVYASGPPESGTVHVSSSENNSGRPNETFSFSSPSSRTSSATPTVSLNPGSNATRWSPVIPSSYTNCFFDPGVSNATFELINVQTFLPIYDKGGIASIPTEVPSTVPVYSFAATPSGPTGIYDIILQNNGNTLYLAIFKSGKVGFTSSSSNGQTYVPDGSDQYITTVFAIDCDGLVTAGILGSTQFLFDFIDNNLVVNPAAPARLRIRDIPVPNGFIVLPPQDPTPNPSALRCPNPDTTAVLKASAPAPSANGCGTDSGPGKYVPDPAVYHECCNGHDYCYSDCSKELSDCNNALLQCSLTSCDAVFFDNDLPDELLHFVCVIGAHVYNWGLNTAIAKNYFVENSKIFCDCVCKDGTKTNCNDKCVDTKSDADNCGACNFFCPSGACANGACAFNSCAGETCDTFGSCGPGGSCVCASIVDHTGFCIDGSTPCDGLAGCSTSEDCPLGAVCAVGTCCGSNVCITAASCGGFDSGVTPKYFMKREWTNATIASRAVWID